MGIKEKQAWRTIVAVLQETGYDKLYDEEVHIVAECLRRCEQQCKKQKEVIDNTIEYINKYESISAYYEYIDEDGYDEYNCDEDFKKELLDILDEVK